MIGKTNPKMTDMTKDYYRGHEIIFSKVEEKWLYKDAFTPTAENPQRSCGHCGMDDTKDGHDGCLGVLSGGVMNACCGHGQENETYVQFFNGERLSGKIAKNWIEESKLREK